MLYIDICVVVIFCYDRLICFQGLIIVEVGDEVFFIVVLQYICVVMSELQCLEKFYKCIMLVGGGNIGVGLVRCLEKDYSVKLIECD